MFQVRLLSVISVIVKRKGKYLDSMHEVTHRPRILDFVFILSEIYFDVDVFSILMPITSCYFCF